MQQALKSIAVAAIFIVTTSAARAQGEPEGTPRVVTFGNDYSRFSITTDATGRTASGTLSDRSRDGTEKVVWNKPLLRTPLWAMAYGGPGTTRFVVTFDKVQRSGVTDGVTIYDGTGGLVKDFPPYHVDKNELAVNGAQAPGMNSFERPVHHESRVELQFFTNDPSGAPVICIISRHRRTYGAVTASGRDGYSQEDLRRTYLKLTTGTLNSLLFPQSSVHGRRYPSDAPFAGYARLSPPGEIKKPKAAGPNPLRAPTPFGANEEVVEPAPFGGPSTAKSTLVPPPEPPFTNPKPIDNQLPAIKHISPEAPVDSPIDSPGVSGIYQAVGGAGLYFLVGGAGRYEIRVPMPAESWRSISLLEGGTQSLGVFRSVSATELGGPAGKIVVGRLPTIGETARSITTLSVRLAPQNAHGPIQLYLVSDAIYEENTSVRP